MTRMRSLWRGTRLFVLLAGLGLQGCAGTLAQFGGGMSRELRQNGLPATARIEEVWDTGWTVNDNPVIGMRVLVRPADRPAFEATIEKTTISRIAVPQFQPGSSVSVRFDPRNPALVAVDFGGPVPSASSSGNPYRDRFEATDLVGASLRPPPAVPQLYLGTADSGADFAALFENDYVPLGSARVAHGSNPQQVLEQGEQIGAALVVLYGRVVPPPGVTFDVLPFRRRPAAPLSDAGATTPVSGLGTDQVATYWGKTRPAILGIVSRPLNGEEQAQLRRSSGIVVESVRCRIASVRWPAGGSAST